MSGKFTRTQEKQYTGWITYPKVGTVIPGTQQVTTKDRPWVLAAPDGIRVVSAQDLATGYLFKTDKGTEPINGQTARAKMVGGVLGWTQVVRNTANVLPVMARHIKGKAYGGLGHFEMYPEQFGPQYTTKVQGDVFVRMFTLHGGLAGIATPEQAAAITPKPVKELVAPTVQAKTLTLDSVKATLEAQLKTVGNYLGKVKGSTATVSAVREDKDGAGTGFIRGDLEFTFPVTTDKKGTLTTPVAVQETDLTKAVFNILPKGAGFGVASSGKITAPLNALAKPLAKAIQEKALEMRKGAAQTAGVDIAQLEATVKAATDIVTAKVAPATYTAVGDGFEVTITDGSMGTVTCVAKQGNPYHCSFIVKDAKDDSAAAKAVIDGLIPADDNVATLKALASAIATGFARIKRQGLVPVTAPVDKPKYEYLLIGKGKCPTTGEQLYVLERIATKARTTMNRPQLLKLLEEKRVENAYVRWYKDDRQIRMRTKGGLATVDVSGYRRSTLNKLEGVQDETVTVYSEVIKNLARDGFTVAEELVVSDDLPVYGKFVVNTPAGHTLTAMFSPSEWQYGVTDGGKVNQKGTIPEDKRRRSMLASSLVSLIKTAAKSAVASTPKNDAPIVPAQDDDFSNPDALVDAYDESIDTPEDFIGTEAPATVETTEPEAGLDAADAFAGLEDAGTPATQEPTPDPRIAQLEGIVETLVVASAAVNTRVTNTLAKTGLTSADCIDAGNDVMEFKREFDLSVSEFNAIVAQGPRLAEFDPLIEKATDRQVLLNNALDKLGEKLRELQVQEANTAAESKRLAEEAEAKRREEEAEAQRLAQIEADRLAAEAEAEAQRLAAEAESARLAEEEDEEEDPFAGLGDDIDTIFRNLPGEIVSEGK